MKTARQSAFEILYKIFTDASYSNLALDSFLDRAEASADDKRFISALVYGVIERQMTLDHQLTLYLNQPLKKLKPQVLVILRLGVFQILYMDKIPTSAAVNESVKLTKNNNCAYASGLVNAVLRKVAANGLILPDKADKNYKSVKYSCPSWLCDLWTDSYGEENAEKLLEASFGAVNTTLRVNTLKIDSASLIGELEKEGISASASAQMENSVSVESGGALHKTQCYEKGFFHVQDIASQLCCKALGACEGDTVIDVCSAPGGKSFTIAEMMNDNGTVISCDIYEHRLGLIKSGAERLGISSVSTMCNDGSIFNENMIKADKILCDVPCSGLGVIRKKPEIRYKKFDEVDKLSNLQYSILCSSSKYLKKDGVLIYSTCSLNPNENENIIKRFLDEHSNFRTEKVLPEIKRYGGDTDYLTLMPHIHNCDGFFIAKLVKTKDV